MSTAALFCDEAGHTGIDLTGADQPFFVASGYFVPDEKIEECRRIATDLLAAVSKERKMAVPELKSSSLVNSAKGRTHLALFLRTIERAGAIPIMIALEKSFSLGGRFVDEHLDFRDNKRASSAYCTDREAKRGAATRISSCSLMTLKAIEDSLRYPTADKTQAAIEAVASDLQDRGLSNLAWVVAGALTSAKTRNPLGSSSKLAFPDFTASNTPNPTSLNALLVSADQYALRHHFTRVNLFHDNTQHMEAALRHAYWLASDPEAHRLISSDPHLESYPRVERVAPPVFLDSLTEPMIQASDLLAGAVAHWLKQAYRREKLDTSTRHIAEATITIFLDGNMPGAGAVFSDDFEWLRNAARQLDKRAWRQPMGEPIR